MNTRYPRLQAVLDELCRAVSADPGRCCDTVRTAAIVAERCAKVPGPAAVSAPQRFPVCALLDSVLASDTPLHAAFRAIAPELVWYRRPGGDDRFQASHANTTLVGPGGLESRDDLWIGATLLAPHTDYPVHQHPPEEIYLVLTAGEWWREGSGWWTPGIGRTLYNRPDVRHTMRSGAAPLFALWALPT